MKRGKFPLAVLFSVGVYFPVLEDRLHTGLDCSNYHSTMKEEKKEKGSETLTELVGFILEDDKPRSYTESGRMWLFLCWANFIWLTFTNQTIKKSYEW